MVNNIIKNIILALSEHDDSADYVLDKKGNKMLDSNLRDFEKIPLKQDIKEYFEKEFKPYQCNQNSLLVLTLEDVITLFSPNK